jgi:hypothetical protein
VRVLRKRCAPAGLVPANSMAGISGVSSKVGAVGKIVRLLHAPRAPA